MKKQVRQGQHRYCRSKGRRRDKAAVGDPVPLDDGLSYCVHVKQIEKASSMFSGLCGRSTASAPRALDAKTIKRHSSPQFQRQHNTSMFTPAAVKSKHDRLENRRLRAKQTVCWRSSV